MPAIRVNRRLWIAFLLLPAAMIVLSQSEVSKAASGRNHTLITSRYSIGKAPIRLDQDTELIDPIGWVLDRLKGAGINASDMNTIFAIVHIASNVVKCGTDTAELFSRGFGTVLAITRLDSLISDCGAAFNPLWLLMGKYFQSPANAVLSVDKQKYHVKDKIRVCYQVPGVGDIVLNDATPDGHVQTLASYRDDGTGDCLIFQVTPPKGKECLLLNWVGSGDNSLTQTCFQVK